MHGMSMLAAVGVTGLTGLHLASIALVALRQRMARPVSMTHKPTVTVIRPVRGLDPFDLETLESTFDLDWPRYDIIFCAAHPDDPACAALRAMIARHPNVPARLMIGEDLATANPKLNNMAKGWEAASGEVVVMADANLLLPSDYLHRLFAVWDDDCALVSSPPAGVRPGNLWGAVECAFLNGFQGRWQLAADSIGLGYAQGKTLMVRKAWLDAAGGLSVLGRNLAEDVAFTKLVRERGAKVRLVRQIFAQPVGGREARAVWDRQLRWSRVRRDGFAGVFAAEILLGFVPPALLLASVAPLAWVLALAMVWYGAEWALCRRSGWPHGPRDVLAMVLRDLMLPALWLSTYARRGFEWRGTRLEVAQHDPA
jgi:ceramide glucosyltransferase